MVIMKNETASLSPPPLLMKIDGPDIHSAAYQPFVNEGDKNFNREWRRNPFRMNVNYHLLYVDT